MEDLAKQEQNPLVGKYPGDSIKKFNERLQEVDRREIRSGGGKREERKKDSWHERMREDLTLINLKRVKQFDKIEVKTNRRLFKLSANDPPLFE